MNRFEKQKKTAFTVLLWIVSGSILLVLWSIFYKKEWSLELILFSFVSIFLLILWMNKKYFSMRKAFYTVDAKWRASNSRLHALEEIKIKIKKDPSLTKMYVEQWGYSDEYTFKTQLAEELSSTIEEGKRLNTLLEEIKITPEINFISYIKGHLWR